MSVSSSTHDGRAAAGSRSVGHRIVVVTGASSGLGLETAKQLASQGAEVVMICRSRTRGEAARAEVAHVATGRPPVLMLADPAGVMGVVTSVMKHTPLFKPADKAAEGIVWAATTQDLNGGNGALYMRRKRLKLKGAAVDESLAGVIWTISERQAGIDPAHSAVAVVNQRGPNHG
jgi:NAD(P)-dependent dehydrogenase (short-subunit alcohol dehydrogenase family)